MTPDEQRDEAIARIGHALMLAGEDPTPEDAANVYAVLEAFEWRASSAALRKKRAARAALLSAL